MAGAHDQCTYRCLVVNGSGRFGGHAKNRSPLSASLSGDGAE